MSHDLVESLEQTLAELESQQMATQQLLDDALAELETLYEELEQRSVAGTDAADSTAGSGETGQAAEAEALTQMRSERNSLEQQLQRLRQEMEQLSEQCQADQPTASADSEAAPPQDVQPQDAEALGEPSPETLPEATSAEPSEEAVEEPASDTKL